MKNLFSLSALVILIMIGFSSCQKDDVSPDPMASSPVLKNASSNVFYSSSTPIGDGVARAWIKTAKNGDPMEVGITLSAKALMNLPMEMGAFVFELPKGKGSHFYTHVLMDWNPMGHEPPGVYDLPHFDFHFYTIPSEKREEIPFMPPPYMDPQPEELYIPPHHMELPGLVPAMGAHWVDLLSPELPPNFQKFTKTFIWGSYAGEFIFWEPMITREYLMSMPDDLIPIPQPQAYQKSGWYPTDYRITYSSNPEEYSVALTNLRWVEGE